MDRDTLWFKVLKLRYMVNVGCIRKNGHIRSVWSCQMGYIHRGDGIALERCSKDKVCGMGKKIILMRCLDI